MIVNDIFVEDSIECPVEQVARHERVGFPKSLQAIPPASAGDYRIRRFGRGCRPPRQMAPRLRLFAQAVRLS